MQYRTFAHQINRAKTLLDGLKTYGAELAGWGVTEEVATGFTNLYNQANQNEQKRNDLKASSRTATAEQEETMAELNKQYGVIKKLVRIALPEEAWPAFGFRAGEYAAKETEETVELKEGTV
ncbi:MAG TPA: hypothetical protein DDW50_18215 [Firmicutes bacterium]|nr:hypothetical protein [Bacillota bacterium]